MKLSKTLSVGLGLALFGGSSQVYAETTVLPAAADTTLFQKSADNNLGGSGANVAGTTLDGNKNRLLLRFDLSAIPANATITGATLNLSVVKAGVGVDSDFTLHRMLVGWTEGMGTGNAGSLANPGEPTWNRREDPATAWGAAGAAADVDFLAADSATTLLQDTGDYAFASTAALVADAQLWLTNQAANFGWILICGIESSSGTARRIEAREGAGGGPTLAVDYTVPTVAIAPVITNVVVATGKITFAFNAESNRSYTVEFTGALPASGWTPLTNFPAAPTAAELTAADALTASNRFYRVSTP